MLYSPTTKLYTVYMQYIYKIIYGPPWLYWVKGEIKHPLKFTQNSVSNNIFLNIEV